MENHIKYQSNMAENRGQISYNKGNQFVLPTIPRTSALRMLKDSCVMKNMRGRSFLKVTTNLISKISLKKNVPEGKNKNHVPEGNPEGSKTQHKIILV